MAWSSSVRTVALTFAATAMLFCGCSGGDGDSGMGGTRGTAGTGGTPDGRILETGLFGTVVAASGQPIEGVIVTVNEASATTNADGEFVIETSVIGSTVARFRAEGYLPTVRKLAIADGSPTAAHVALKPRGLATSMSADTGGTAMGDRQASVTVEPGDLSGPDGSSVTGMVDVSITPVDPSFRDEVQALTGSFDDGVNLLESFGMVFITIMQGNIELQVAAGQTLLVIIPSPAGASPNDLPATMPLWFLNQNTGQWEEEGTLTLDENRDAFVGEVDRMASWNADVPATSTCITGLAVDDEEGEPIAGAEVDAKGLNYFGSSTGSTGDDGRFYIPVRKSSQVLVSVSHAAEGGASSEVMSGAGDTALPPTPGDTRCLDIGTFTVRREIVIVPEPTTGTGGLGGSGGTGGVAVPPPLEWFPQNSPVNEAFLGVSFADADTGTAVGIQGRIVRTTDGGATWVAQNSGYGGNLFDVSMIDANTGTAVGIQGTILRTTDGGATWVAQNSGTNGLLGGVSFTDANTGTAVGETGTIVRTTDGGATWVAQNSGTGQWFHGVWFTDANTGTAVGRNGVISQTTDGGATWVVQNSGTTQQLENVSFSDADTGTVVGIGGTILRTTDGGATWVAQESGVTGGLYDVFFLDADYGVAVGAYGVILRTTDGGATWVAQNSGTEQWLRGVSFTDATTGTAVGTEGTILRTIDVGVEFCDNNIDDDGDTLVDCGDPQCCVQRQCETSSTCFSGGAIATGPFAYEGQPGGAFSYVVNFSAGSVTMYGVPVDWPGGEVGHSGQLQGDLSAVLTFSSGGESTMGTVQYTCLDVPTCIADTPTSSRVEIIGTRLSLPTFPDAVPGAGGITYDTFATGTCLFGDPPTTPCAGSVMVYPRPTF